MPTTRKNMADISSDQALNGLKIKTDALPNDWYVTLVNPQNGEPGENMSIARFVELFTSKQPEVTESSKGLMSSLGLKSNPSNARVNRKILDVELIAKKAFRVRKKSGDVNFNIKILGGWTYGNAYGVIEKVISYYLNGNMAGTKVYKCSNNTCGIFYISDPYKDGDYICVDIVNKYTEQSSVFAVILESYYTLDSFEFTNNQTPRSEDLTKNNRDETEFALKTSANTLASSPNALTETVVEEVPVSADTPMTLQEDGQPVPMTQTVERYEYSVPKMAEAILALQKEIAELKGGAGKE
ncbi:hypothetical protein NBH15_25515 [Parabacteroides sp. W1-Q-101]|nr:hypothetical protein [Parabacteroides sp. W1-Q-101]